MMLVTADAPLWIVSRVMVRSRCEELISYWKLANRTFSAGDIHDLRVSSRRLREAIALFATCYPTKNLSHVKAEAKYLTNLLGTMRNTDEALLFFTPLLPSLPETLAPSLVNYLDLLQYKRVKEHRYLEHRLKELDIRFIRRETQRALKRPYLFESSAYDPFMPISQFFSVKLMEREILLQQLLPDSLCEQNSAALHRLRIALKRFRYAFELSAPLIADGYKALYSVVKGFQETLGKIHDLDVFMEQIHEQKFEPECSIILLELVASRRRSLFADFLILHDADPIDKLGERARELL